MSSLNRFLNKYIPKFENVAGIKSGKEFNDFFHNVILKTFEDSGIGYKVKYKTLVSSSFGVPQNRERLIVWGHKDSIKLPRSDKETVSAGDAISDIAFKLNDDDVFLITSA